MKETTLTLSPLEKTYAAQSRPMPQVEFVDAQDIPEPYQRLLVHKDDMTETLEYFYQQKMELRVLEQQPTEHLMLRQVLLISHDTHQPVEFGAITIHLDYFTSDAQNKILEGIVPLGAIFREQTIKHTSNPQAYFKIWSDETITDLLKLDQPQWLWGRQNVHRNLDGNVLAEMVEILPPYQEAAS